MFHLYCSIAFRTPALKFNKLGLIRLKENVMILIPVSMR